MQSRVLPAARLIVTTLICISFDLKQAKVLLNTGCVGLIVLFDTT